MYVAIYYKYGVLSWKHFDVKTDSLEFMRYEDIEPICVYNKKANSMTWKNNDIDKAELNEQFDRFKTKYFVK